MKQALLIMPPGALIAGPAGPAGADGAAGAAGADGPAGAGGAAGAAGADGADGADGRDGGVVVVPFASVLNVGYLIAYSTGHCVWLVNGGSSFSWIGGWGTASASQDVMQYVVVGNDGTNVFLLPIGESSAGTFSANTPQPMTVPLTCVKAGTPAAGGYLGAAVIEDDELFVFQASFASPGFIGACYLKVLTVTGDYLTSVAGGTISYGG